MADNKKVLGERSVKVTIFTSGSFFVTEYHYFAIFELVPV